MYISKIQLQSFGKFCDDEIQLYEGINCIYGKNEEGKSTIKNFMSYIFSSLHQPYAQERISKMYRNYKPFKSKDFQGSLFCENVHALDHEAITISQDFNTLIGPIISNKNSDDMATLKDSINIIGFHELKGEKSKDLLLDILNRIEDIKNSNLYGIHANEVFSNLENKIDMVKTSSNIISLTHELESINDMLKDYEARYASYKNNAHHFFRLKDELKNISKSIELKEKLALKSSKENLVDLYEFIHDLNIQITKYEQQIQELEKYESMDFKEAEEALNYQKSTQSLLEAQDELKINYERLGTVANNLLRGRDYRKFQRLAIPEDIVTSREKLFKLKDQVEAINNTQNTIIDFKELKAKAIKEQEIKGDKEREVADITKEYFKYINILDWGKTIEERIESFTRTQPDHNEESQLILENQKRKRVMAGAILLIILGSILFVFTIWPTLLIALIGFIGLGWLGYQMIDTKERIEQLHSSFKTYELELNKYMQMGDENKTKLQEIIRRHDCKNEDEFLLLYDKTKDVYADFKDFDKKISDFVATYEAQLVGLKMTHKRIYEMEEMYQIELIHALDDPSQLRQQFDIYVKEAKEYVEIFNQREVLRQRINELDRKIQDSRKQYGLEDDEMILTQNIEENTKELHLSRFELERLVRIKKEKLLNISDIQLEQYIENIHENPELEPVIDSEESEQMKEECRQLRTLYVEKSQELSKFEQAINKESDYIITAIEMKRKKAEIQQVIDGFGEVKRSIDSSINILRNSSQEISGSITQSVEEKIGHIIYDLTQKYSKIRFNEDMELQFFASEANNWLPVSHLSTGVIDQIYIALKLAIVEITQGYNDFPLIFDDSFVQFDKKRLGRLLKYLASLKRQVIILTCHKREEEALEELNIPCALVRIS